ncbi:hypothetical protein [Paractinoplanes brasiliensis]|uniref:Uncharacterized protein n=1 Tax=Paractinoplanes brasiliensis TaxID=52695 RepID=A0A4R6J8B2_9ACTN|nr:hypothetical protein [Actinoplanes brasiliensis]TDO31824.1 hypothetical protein C8E87_7257 [Actinoplanes brasiliensis]GID30578.1 hypothetical protein Abr02nite_55610 [Actinoplanes brasiliensis]
MTATTTINRTVAYAGWAGLAGGVTSAVAGAIQTVRAENFDPVVDRTEHVLLTMIALTLVLWIPAYLGLGRRAGTRTGRIGAGLAAFGCGLLAFGTTSTNLHDRDYSWFSVVAVPANASWLIGSIMLAVACFRTRALPRWLAVATGLVMPLSIVLSQAGGNLLAGAIWGAVGWLLIVNARTSKAA